MGILPAVARWTGFIEKYVLSLLFLKIAIDRARPLPGMIESMRGGSIELAGVTLHVLVLLFGLFFGLNLLAAQKPVRDPASWTEIVIALIATLLFYGFTGLAPYAPEFTTRNLLPLSLQRDAAIAAMLMSVVGYAIALWSVAYLGRSLAVVVSVRTVVHGGPYCLVRHPMYLGYFFLVIGMVFASASILAGILLVTFLVLTVYRANLEESALCAFSEEYRQYAARTGFLFPRVGA